MLAESNLRNIRKHEINFQNSGCDGLQAGARLFEQAVKLADRRRSAGK